MSTDDDAVVEDADDHMLNDALPEGFPDDEDDLDLDDEDDDLDLDDEDDEDDEADFDDEPESFPSPEPSRKTPPRPLDPEEAATRAAICGLLAHEGRVAILLCLLDHLQGRVTRGVLRAATPPSNTHTFTANLRLLKTGGLVLASREGRYIYYSLSYIGERFARAVADLS